MEQPVLPLRSIARRLLRSLRRRASSFAFFYIFFLFYLFYLFFDGLILTGALPFSIFKKRIFFIFFFILFIFLWLRSTRPVGKGICET
jgi:hypothetical protein